MKKTYTSILLLLVIVQFGFGQQSRNMLVSPSWLQERVNDDDIVILAIGKEESYAKEHIPGALMLDWEEYTFNDDTHDFDLRTVAELKDIFESKGLDDGDKVVIYTSDNWVSMITRVYFTLDYLGYADNTYLLDGGIQYWKAEGGAVTDEVKAVKKGNFTPKPRKEILADRAYVLSHLNNNNVNIVDGRATVFYEGIDAGNGGRSRKGHIPGAKSIPYTSLAKLADHGAYKFKSLQEMEEIFKAQNLDHSKQLLLYCHIGMQLTVVYTAAKMLGYKDIKVYDGSFYEWGPDASLPIELETN
ncbi:sulfurtransferase [Fulvivirga lutimaris]|uniref:sulfurtransferase n=1 Tax=Fulvivirga lutimaris TaxID=1819566 RepID=UPI0012BB6567|nr:sulfurtransferase [Fulvivirga lutimaris]MTI39689.1 sulfurtransferase [Fulvivirga lutimaris]